MNVSYRTLNLSMRKLPIIDPAGRVFKHFPSCCLANTNASRGSSRFRTAPTDIFSGNAVGKSLTNV